MVVHFSRQFQWVKICIDGDISNTAVKEKITYLKNVLLKGGGVFDTYNFKYGSKYGNHDWLQNCLKSWECIGGNFMSNSEVALFKNNLVWTLPHFFFFFFFFFFQF